MHGTFDRGFLVGRPTPEMWEDAYAGYEYDFDDSREYCREVEAEGEEEG